MKYKDNEITRKLSELQVLHGRLGRYWKKLVKESLEIAKARGLEICIIEACEIANSDIMIKKQGDEIDVDSLIELARNKFPSLYRRYCEGKERYETDHNRLQRISDSHDARANSP